MSKVLKKWEDYGFLEGIEDDKKPIVAVYYEELYNFFIMTENEGKFPELETTTFPLIRRVLDKTNFEYKKSVSEFVSDVESIRDGRAFKKLEGDLAQGCYNMIDCEAELIVYMGDIIIENHGRDV